VSQEEEKTTASHVTPIIEKVVIEEAIIEKATVENRLEMTQVQNQDDRPQAKAMADGNYTNVRMLQ
jgi:hypothetical protein